ncbi:MAG: hypothetical protein AB1601_10665 [Planctomycetota bacterium]
MMMSNYPNDFIPLEVHIGDSYETSWGSNRNTFYAITGTPTVWFDGVTSVVGAGSAQSAFQNYQAAYLARKAVPTDVLVEMTACKIAANVVRTKIKVSVEPGGTAKSIRLQIVQLLDHWPASPTYSRNTVMQGTVWPIYITLNPGESREVPANFTLDSNSMAQPADVKFVAFAQLRKSNAPADIYNAAWLGGPFDFRRGDVNCDGEVDFGDINPFVLILTNPAAWQAQYPTCDPKTGDINGDGIVDFGDINPFVSLLTGS